jgi:hypothetical protein
MRRVLDVARVLTVNWFMVIGLPLVVLALAFALNLAIFAVIGDEAPEEGWISGAVMSVYITMGIAHVQTITQVFPFALGLSVTRRAFYAATALVVVAQSLVYGLVLVADVRLEAATDDGGLGVRFFGLPFLVQGNVVAQWLVYAVPLLAVTAIGVFMGVVFERWGQPGVYVVGLGTAVLATAFVLVVTWQRWWPAVGSFFASQSSLALFAGYPLVIALVLGGAGWLALRRATP